MGRRCYGRDLRGISDEEIIAEGVNLEYIIEAYKAMGMGDKFFTRFFENLIGSGKIRGMIERGASAEEIKASWLPDVERFKKQREPYLIYPLN